MLKDSILTQASACQKLIAFRTEKQEWGETIIGYVKSVTTELITINEIDEYGLPIGTTTFRLDDLIDIMIDDKTLSCLEILESKNKQLSPAKSFTFWGNSVDIRKYILARMKEGKPIVLFVEDGDTNDTNIIGLIAAVDDISVMIDLIDRYGEKDGKIIVPLDTITGIRWNGQEDVARWLLYENRYKKNVSDKQ